MAGRLRDRSKLAIDEVSPSILFHNSFTTVNSKEAKQFLVKPVGSRWVFKTKRNPNESTRYKTHQVVKANGQTDFGEPYAPVGNLTAIRYLICLVGRCGWIVDHLEVVTALLNPDVDDHNIYTALPKVFPHEDMHKPLILVRLRQAIYGLEQSLCLWHNDINTFLLCLRFILRI
jgi:hypothetical protein